MPSLKLISLNCHVPDETNLDEVYLKMEGIKVWPLSEKYQQLPLGETLLNLSIDDISKDGTVEIELWDFDTLSRDDKLGSFVLHLDQSGKFQTEMKKHDGTGASYSLEWEYY